VGKHDVDIPDSSFTAVEGFGYLEFAAIAFIA
jgi:hypothetical protein